MRIATANIKNFPDMRPGAVKADGLAVSEVADLWGQQENNPAEDLPDIVDVLGPDWLTVHKETNIPLYYRGSVLRLDGARRIAAPFEPVLPLAPRPRWITGATFTLRDRPGVPRFAVVDCHLIAGGMNGPEEPARRRQWTIEFHALRGFVASYRAKGLTTFVLGDFNHPRPPKPLPNFAWLVGERLDRIGVSTAGSVVVDEVDSGTLALNSDHNAQWSRVLLSERVVHG